MSNITRKRKAERTLERKRKQQLYLLVGIIVAMILIVGGIAAAQMNFTSTVPSDTTGGGENSEGGTYAGLQRGLTEDGLPILGDPDAPLSIVEFSSFGCGHCMNFHDSQFMQLLPLVADGTVNVVFGPVTNSFSVPASAASFCALDQGKFWEMHDILFGYLGAYGGNAYTADKITSAAQALSLDMDAFNACLTEDTAAMDARLNAANTLFFDLTEQYPDVTGTPTITFNGVPPAWGSGAPPMEYINEQIAAITG
jgi:protein-disulfide isomerase